ncbi:ABC transporter substrate-binding protein [Jatrophihabitans sp. GAS493]|uniref:ABC transporter substrate-binding protein n=1 Tax=Jatrophihabitans sp. GAS493 TaxID=1907575 RepID=UPI0012FD5831|nr:ABC transporter substrate-binding protein [Jatrophihabitans sp. GAS493]
MVTGTLSSPNLSYPQQQSGAEAAAKAINANGGIDGHPIQIVVCNDGLDPNKAIACAQKAKDEGVVALDGGIEEFSAQMWPKLEASNIPWVAPVVIAADQGTNKMSFPLSGGITAAFMQTGRLAVEKGGKNVVIFEHENSQAKFTGDIIAQGVKLAGGTVVKTVISKLGSTDTSAAAAQAIAAHPDAIGCACNQGDAARLLQSVVQAGFKGPFAGSISSFTNSDLSSLGSAANQIVAGADMLGPDAPAAAQWVSEMNANDSKAEQDNISGGAWLAVHVVADLLKGQSDLSSKNLTSILNTSPSINIYGMAGDSVTFTKPGPIPATPRVVNMNAMSYGVKDGKFAATATTFTNPLTGQ